MLLFQLQLQPTLKALSGMEVMVVAVPVAVPASSASSAWYGGLGCCCCSCSSSRPCLLCQGRRVALLQLQFQQTLLAQPERKGRSGLLQLQLQFQPAQLALPGMEVMVVAVAVAVAAISASSVRYGGQDCCCSSCNSSQLC